MNPAPDPPYKEPEPINPLTQRVKRRRKTKKVSFNDNIKVGTIWIEKREITFDF